MMLKRRPALDALSDERVRRRFKRILVGLAYAANLSETESIACLQAFARGDKYSGEAVNHYGGTTRCMIDALAILRDVRAHRTDDRREGYVS